MKKKRVFFLTLLLASTFLLSSCSILSDLFDKDSTSITNSIDQNKTYRVKFDVGSGTLTSGVNEYKVPLFGTLNEIPEATHPNLTFVGWFTSKDGLGQNLNLETHIANNTTYYAYYATKVTLNFNNGQESETFYLGENKSKFLNSNLTYKDFEFLGWFPRNDDGTLQDTSITYIYADRKEIVVDALFSCTVTIFKSASDVTSYNININDPVQPLDMSPIDGNEVEGWFYIDNNEQILVDNSFIPNGNVTLFPKFKNKNAIFFLSEDKSLNNIYFNKGETYTFNQLPLARMTSTDKYFYGWQYHTHFGLVNAYKEDVFDSTTVLCAEYTNKMSDALLHSYNINYKDEEDMDRANIYPSNESTADCFNYMWVADVTVNGVLYPWGVTIVGIDKAVDDIVIGSVVSTKETRFKEMRGFPILAINKVPNSTEGDFNPNTFNMPYPDFVLTEKYYSNFTEMSNYYKNTIFDKSKYQNLATSYDSTLNRKANNYYREYNNETRLIDAYSFDNENNTVDANSVNNKVYYTPSIDDVLKKIKKVTVKSYYAKYVGDYFFSNINFDLLENTTEYWDRNMYINLPNLVSPLNNFFGSELSLYSNVTKTTNLYINIPKVTTINNFFFSNTVADYVYFNVNQNLVLTGNHMMFKDSYNHNKTVSIKVYKDDYNVFYNKMSSSFGGQYKTSFTNLGSFENLTNFKLAWDEQIN